MGFINKISLFILFACSTFCKCEQTKGIVNTNDNTLDSTIVSLSNSFTSAVLPISVLKVQKGKQNCLIEVNVFELDNPENVPIQILISTGLNDNMLNIGTFSLYPSNMGGNYLIDISPYVDVLCSGKTRDIRIEIANIDENQHEFKLKMAIKQCK